MKTLLLATCFSLCTHAAFAADNAYEQTNLIANKRSYNPTIAMDKKLINAWGIAIRPAGAGGHFWVTGADTSFEYVGDVSASKDEKLRTLHTDDLKTVKLPVGGKSNFATGVVFSDSKEHFTITQKVGELEPITAPAKFLFASDGGIISAWTERKKEDGTFDRASHALKVIDESTSGAQFFGLAISSDFDRLYTADFGAQPGIKVYDGNFKPENISFDMPFDENKNNKVDPGEYAPFNIQALTTPKGEHRIFVAYAKTQSCPEAEVKKKTCAEGEIFAGEEDTDKPGQGRIAEFKENGELVAVWKDEDQLSAPWGMAFAPDDFGALSGKLLVANFGSGTIAAFDPSTRQFKDVMRNANGKPIEIDKIWGVLFGNGESLGDKDALYFAAGPRDEKDGVFGNLRMVEKH